MIWASAFTFGGMICFSCSEKDVRSRAALTSVVGGAGEASYVPGGHFSLCCHHYFPQNCLGESSVFILRLLKLPFLNGSTWLMCMRI